MLGLSVEEGVKGGFGGMKLGQKAIMKNIGRWADDTSRYQLAYKL